MFSFTQLLFALFLFICYEYYLQNKKNLVLLWAPHSEEKQRLKMTHLFFYLELKTKTQGHITNNIYHYKMKVVFVNQDNRVNVAYLSYHPNKTDIIRKIQLQECLHKWEYF